MIPSNIVAFPVHDTPDILDHLLIGVIQIDIEGYFTYINEAACRLLQTTEEDIVGKSTFDSHWTKVDAYGNPLPADRFPLATALREGKPSRGIECGLKFGDHTTWLSVQVAPLYNDLKEMTGAVAYLVEISDNKATEKESLQREQRLSSIANSQTSYLVRTDLKGQFSYVNDAFLNKYGYLQEEVLGRVFTLITDPDDVKPCIAVANECAKFPGESRSIEIRGVNKQRDYFWTEWELVGIADESRKVTEIQAVGRDISDEKRTEGLLAETSRMARVGGWELTSLTQNLSWTNETYRIHDLPANVQVSLRRAIKFYHSNHQPIIKKAIKKLIADGESFDVELKIITEQGREVWVRTQGQREAHHGNFIRIYGVIQDITERKLAEEQMILNNEKLQKINQELDRFVYSASHDLRAPLTSMIGLINLSSLEELPPVIVEYLSLMKKSADKLDSFIQDLTNFSRNARTEIKNSRVDFKDMVDTIFEQHKFMDDSKEADMQADIEQSVDFYSDSNRLEVVFCNIISNAVKYNNTFTEKTLVAIKISVAENKASIRISDNGMGIAQEHLERIFEMFYRATDQRQGSGLGLYIVKETIEKLNGKVQVSSELGVGTTFTFEVPNMPPEEE